MTEPPDQTIEALKSLVNFLFKRVTEVSVRAEAMRCLLENHGVFSNAEFEQMRVAAQAQWDTRFQAVMSEALSAAAAAEMRRLLESFEGTKQ
jgi:hypothetical protein